MNIGDSISGISHKINLQDSAGLNVDLKGIQKDRVLLLIVLRHFGCIGCSEHVEAWVPRISDFKKLGIEPVFIGNGAAHYIDGFLERHGLEKNNTAVFTDPSLSIHRELSLRRSLFGVLNIKTLINSVRAFGKGHIQTSIEGDSLQQGGVMLFDYDGILRFCHRERAIGDFIDPSIVMEEALKIINRKVSIL